MYIDAPIRHGKRTGFSRVPDSHNLNGRRKRLLGIGMWRRYGAPRAGAETG
jgi:hypothetical protein